MLISRGILGILFIIAAGIAMALYTMRRRTRLGRRKPTI
jgi:hypothetical protein